MNSAPPRGKVFRDPVHRLIKVQPANSFVTELVDNPVVQRLRRIRQLGVSWLTYHGAEHSRFSHTMGVFHLAGRIIGTLRNRYFGFEEIGSVLDQNENTVLAAAILHDVGHAPFSHAMERLFKANADHEDRSISLLLDEDCGIPSILRKANISPDAVRDILKKIHPPRFLCDIISSQLDADRMDYLLRDSLLTGVEYGRFDLDWLASHLCLGLEPLSGETSKERPPLRLCLDRKRGQFSAEQLMIGRYHMTMQVYFHPVTRGWEAQLLCLLRRAANLAINRKESVGVELSGMPDPLSGTPAPLLEFLERQGAIDNATFLQLDDGLVMTAFQAWTRSCDGYLAELADAIISRKKHTKSGDRIFVCFDLTNLEPHQIGKLQAFMEYREDEFPSYKWDLDDIQHWNAYKDFFRVVRNTKGQRNEVNGTSAILLSNGALDTVGEPVEFSSDLFKTMGVSEVSVVRLYVHHSISAPIKSELDKIKKI